MGNPERPARLAGFGHRVAIQGGHERIRRARRVEENGRNGPTDGGPFHHPIKNPRTGRSAPGV